MGSSFRFYVGQIFSSLLSMGMKIIMNYNSDCLEIPSLTTYHVPSPPRCAVTRTAPNFSTSICSVNADQQTKFDLDFCCIPQYLRLYGVAAIFGVLLVGYSGIKGSVVILTAFGKRASSSNVVRLHL